MTGDKMKIAYHLCIKSINISL